jgi:acyl carrier protein
MTKHWEYQEIYDGAKTIITNYLRLKKDELQPDSHIVDDMGADSLALVELGFQLSEKFSVPLMDTSDEIMIFKNLVRYIYESQSQTPSAEKKE